VQEATERFQLIAEAYSVLRDPEQRALYDSGGAAGNNSGYPQAGGFSVGKARDLFREVFGSEFADNLASAAVALAGGLEKVAEGAAPHVKAAAVATAEGLTLAAEKCGRTSVVRGAVGAHLSAVTDSACSLAAHQVQTESLCRRALEEQMKKLEDHKAKLAIVHQERQKRSMGLWGSMRELVTGEQQAADEEYDLQAAKITRRLNRRLEEAEDAWRRSLHALKAAESMALRAQREEEEVQQNGATLGQAASAGMHLLRQFSKQIMQA